MSTYQKDAIINPYSPNKRSLKLYGVKTDKFERETPQQNVVLRLEESTPRQNVLHVQIRESLPKPAESEPVRGELTRAATYVLTRPPDDSDEC